MKKGSLQFIVIFNNKKEKREKKQVLQQIASNPCRGNIKLENHYFLTAV